MVIVELTAHVAVNSTMTSIRVKDADGAARRTALASRGDQREGVATGPPGPATGELNGCTRRTSIR
jgi:hypothetical protein